MKYSPRILLTTGFVVVTLSQLHAAEPAGYYQTIAAQSGAQLKTALHNVIKNHAFLQYTPTRDALAITDEDPTNNTKLTLIYSRRAEPKANFVGTTGSGAVTATQWNREHLWPNSLGIDDAVPAYSDLFNLRPADVDVNNRRGNLYFDESSTSSGTVTADPEAPLCTKDSDSWEVPAAVKGDIARSMFYMDIRYEGGVAGEPNLELTDAANEITSTSAKFGRLTTLLLWHFTDPVDAAERLRNDRVYTAQQNRNPFVDHPEWVARAYVDPLEVKFSVQGNQLKLAWWANLTTRQPQVSTSLTLWTNLIGTPVIETGYKTLLIPITPQRQFFRIPYNAPDVP